MSDLNATSNLYDATTDVGGGFSAFPVVFPPILERADRPIELDRGESRRATSVPSERCCVWGVEFDRVTMEQAVERIDGFIASRANTYAITANLNYLMLCDRDERLSSFTAACPLVLCDGKPIEWRSRFKERPLPERVAGADLIYALSELSAAKGYSLYLLGGAEGVAAEAASRLIDRFPGLRIAGVDCPPFGAWSDQQRSQINRRIAAAQPDILLVAFGQPKGEYWIEDNYRELGVPVSIQVGASFDFVVGRASRAPSVMQKIGAEWLYRACFEPKRLVPRYAANLRYLFKSLRRELTI